MDGRRNDARTFLFLSPTRHARLSHNHGRLQSALSSSWKGGSNSRLLDAKFGRTSAHSLHRPRSGRFTSKPCPASEWLSILHTNALAAFRFLLHPLEAARQSSFYRRIHPINKKNSVQMIDFMLNGTPEQPACFDFDPAVFQSLRAGDH